MPEMPLSANPRVLIALCTRNGARFLSEQLASYSAQDYPFWDLWVSDDGSDDATLEVVERWARRWQGQHDVHVLSGPQAGAATNFLTLLCHQDFPTGRPVALSDQDDIWHEHKLSRAMRKMAQAGGHEMLLYGAQSLHVDAGLKRVGRSRPPRRPPSFANALTQNVVSGHSAVLSPAALDLARQAGIPHDIPFHDWWLYQLISGAGGRVWVDDAIVLSYRQHGANEMGAHRGVRASLSRLGQIAGGEYGRWIRANLSALSVVADKLTPQAREILDQLGHGKAPLGMRRIRRAGLVRQGRLANLALYLAAVGGKL